MGLERGELARPQRLGFGKPLPELRRRAVLQRIDAHACVEGGVAILNQPALLQRLQVAAHRGRRKTKLAREFARAAWLLSQQFDRAPPHRLQDLAALQVGVRARLKAANGKTRSEAMFYQRRTLAADASTYLADTNTRRVRRALKVLFGGAVAKDTVRTGSGAG